MSDLTTAARALRAARQRLDTAMATAEQAAIDAHARQVPETEIARELGVNRMTVRRWLGKQTVLACSCGRLHGRMRSHRDDCDRRFQLES